ncbi:cystinosis, nephropathic, putative [Acanthamoeba castellanii str. Neff]|uniref:Cystinosis, nephropathic, putative n=1 Tax=Acanthamoeba castellanii (strain ATCC 30010 / Neff) TaxID=1257118 RepID=L8HIQ6_ACACF|nr:cystinosis, nephropathic, putative [Acanthamoeba castellanii str. Neff]ELR24573.1 cystinosis, nephropathic, putative [Acanthamoeba castellanii str. Neff]
MTVLSILSDVCGWVYFVAWSVSFYPQIYRNWSRKSVVGLSFDFVVYNLLGFTCYSIYMLPGCAKPQHQHALMMSQKCAEFWSKRVREEYREANDGDEVSVQINDVVFALHGVAMVLLTMFQCLIYEGLGYVKAAITVIKYSPQVYINYKLQSTEGWSIWQVLLDVVGGLLSFLQNGLTAIDQGDASPFKDYPKLALALISLVFDAIFIIQHYFLYGHRASSSTPSLYDEVGDSEWEGKERVDFYYSINDKSDSSARSGYDSAFSDDDYYGQPYKYASHASV